MLNHMCLANTMSLQQLSKSLLQLLYLIQELSIIDKEIIFNQKYKEQAMKCSKLMFNFIHVNF